MNDTSSQETYQEVLDTRWRRSTMPSRRIYNDDFLTYQVTEINNADPKTIIEAELTTAEILTKELPNSGSVKCSGAIGLG
jgi:hypothetical protein